MVDTSCGRYFTLGFRILHPVVLFSADYAALHVCFFRSDKAGNNTLFRQSHHRDNQPELTKVIEGPSTQMIRKAAIVIAAFFYSVFLKWYSICSLFVRIVIIFFRNNHVTTWQH